VKQVETREIIVGIATDIDLLHYISRHDAQNHATSSFSFYPFTSLSFVLNTFPKTGHKNGNEKKRMIKIVKLFL
jgi:hypothetical protein